MIGEAARTENRVKVNRRARRLSALTYLLRNANRTIPLTGVIMLAVVLIAGIVALMNSIPLSIRTTYSYSKQLVAITPRGDAGLTPTIKKTIAHPPVPIERVIVFRASSSQVQSIVGKWPFFVIGLTHPDMIYFLRKMGAANLEGRLPNKGKPEAVVSEPVARNLGLRLGSTLLSPDDQDNYSPHEVKVVGIAETNEWIMADDLTYQKQNNFPPVDNLMVFARNLHDQTILDEWAVKVFKGNRASVFTYLILEQQTQENFRTMFAILDVVIGMLVLVITIMMGMLINIYQSQRLIEFGLLQAIGYTKRQLLKRVLTETCFVLVLGWSLGVVCAYGLLDLAYQILMYPRAYALDTFDPMALRYTIPVPISILLVALLTVWIRFRKFDPVGVVERRLL